jgi:hypothetical protein
MAKLKTIMKRSTAFIATCLGFIMASCTNTSENSFVDGVSDALSNDGKVSKVLSKLAFPALMILAAVFFLQYRKEKEYLIILLTYVYFIRRKQK